MNDDLNGMTIHATGRGIRDKGEWLVGRVMDDGPTGELFIAANGSLLDHIKAPLSGNDYTAIRIDQKNRRWLVAELAKMLTDDEWQDVREESESERESTETS